MNKYLQQLIEYFRTPALQNLDRKAILAVMFGSAAMNILLFAVPLYSLQVFDRVLTSRSAETLVLLTLIVLFALTASALLDGMRSRLLLRIGNAYSLTMGPKLLDAAITGSATNSAPNSQPLRDLNVVRNFVAGAQGLPSIFDTPMVLLFLAVVYMMHVGLGHAMLFGVLVLLVLTALTESLTGPDLRAANEAAIDAQRRIDAVVQNAEVVEAMGMRAAMREYWHSAQSASMAEASSASDKSQSFAAFARWIRLLLSLMMTGLGAWYVIHDQITIGAMVAANMLSARGLAPLETMIGAWKGLVGARLAVERMNRALEKFARQESETRLPDPRGELAVERLVYVPPGAEQPVLKGISFNLPAGSLLGLVGPSAAGKSTLAKLICGVWRPRSGTVRLDGADVFLWERSDFGRHCGYLPQDVELFSGSVRDNIARFRSQEEIEDAQVIDAARMAGVHDLILRLPKGYDTQIGPGGAALSAGQRQRVGLARALLGRPRLVVLDEPNSNLDTEGEQALVSAMREAKADGMTMIVISHRPSLLADADLIGVVVDGQLQQFGRREDVMQKIQPAAAPLRQVPVGGRHG